MPVISSAIAAFATTLGATAAAAGTIGAVGAAAAYGAGAVALSNRGKDDKGPDTSGFQRNAAAIEKKSKEAEVVAEQEAKDKTRKKLSQQTRTIFTSGLGLLGTDNKNNNSTLGGN